MRTPYPTLKPTLAPLHPAVLSYINACADDHVLATMEGQLDCDFCPVKSECLAYCDNFIAAGNGGPGYLRCLDAFRHRKLITTLILILTLFEKGLTPLEGEKCRS